MRLFYHKSKQKVIFSITSNVFEKTVQKVIALLPGPVQANIHDPLGTWWVGGGEKKVCFGRPLSFMIEWHRVGNRVGSLWLLDGGGNGSNDGKQVRVVVLACSKKSLDYQDNSIRVTIIVRIARLQSQDNSFRVTIIVRIARLQSQDNSIRVTIIVRIARSRVKEPGLT
ncbi:hypothetical protein CHS0354_038430 [Potamilus streckersoni]|uniref:Uncharacterized protein n=1 Tax=Potamilus streckersoni TaxID=2493646 RepID=A0AAE0S657_9BIVA|nr:hypothetical protein CHS0354_038430 [Potamilus streckersoni]